MTIVAKRKTTAQAELFHLLDKGLTVKMILERTHLTEQYIIDIADGKQTEEWVFDKLFSLSVLLEIADQNEQSPDEVLERLIAEKHMKYAFFNDCPSANEPACYADKHGV